MQQPIPLSIFEKHCISSNGNEDCEEEVYEALRYEDLYVETWNKDGNEEVRDLAV
ncbi:hypothetical protein HQN89_02580 [Paenibacillus frigoriresistens]|uniref:hypothetical protein n=1 Tax=Paenibacillus alginolyticus TaxID=59839 RepID=UPI0015668324|nr:hypothetical protein [Paenibacillus frigoriresistens]NRF89924.1 hypothetical protein [Paenibacillus frigoriresistens]